MQTPHLFQLSPLAGVYRFRRRIGGCAAWYAVDATGEMVDFRIVRPGMSEAATVWDLAQIVYGASAGGPLLTLIRPAVSAAPDRRDASPRTRVPSYGGPALSPAE